MITAAYIVAINLIATALFVVGTTCGCAPGMNTCWIASFALMYAPILWSIRAQRRAS